MKSLTGEHHGSTNSTNRALSFFEKNFALIAGKFTPVVPQIEEFPQYLIIRTGPEIIRLNTKSIEEWSK